MTCFMRFINQLEPTHTHTHHTSSMSTPASWHTKTSAKSTARKRRICWCSSDEISRSFRHYSKTLGSNPLKIHVSAVISASTGDDSAIFRLPIVKGYMQGFLLDSLEKCKVQPKAFQTYPSKTRSTHWSSEIWKTIQNGKCMCIYAFWNGRLKL